MTNSYLKEQAKLNKEMVKALEDLKNYGSESDASNHANHKENKVPNDIKILITSIISQLKGRNMGEREFDHKEYLSMSALEIRLDYLNKLLDNKQNQIGERVTADKNAKKLLVNLRSATVNVLNHRRIEQDKLLKMFKPAKRVRKSRSTAKNTSLSKSFYNTKNFFQKTTELFVHGIEKRLKR